MECDEKIFSNLRNWMSNIWNSIKDNTVELLAVYGVRHVEFLQICVTAYKSIISKIKSHIGGMVDAIKKDLIN